MSIFLERLSMWNMLIWAEQERIRKYETHAYKTLKKAGVQTIMLKHPTKGFFFKSIQTKANSNFKGGFEMNRSGLTLWNNNCFKLC